MVVWTCLATDFFDGSFKTWNNIDISNATIVYSSPKKAPSSHTKTSLSTSGSTAIPKSAPKDLTLLHKSVKLSGIGSGYWENIKLISEKQKVNKTYYVEINDYHPLLMKRMTDKVVPFSK